MTPPPPFEFGSGDSFEEVCDCIPPRLLALAAKGPALLGLDTPVVVVAGLAHLAASSGRSCLLDDGSTLIPPCFSLAVLSDSLLPFDWLSVLGRGWVDEATRIQNLDSDHVRAVIKEALRNVATKGPDRSSIDPQFAAYAEKLPLNVVNMMRQRTILSRVDPDAAARAVVDSRDHCAVIMNGAGDPMAEWAQLPPGKQQKLTEMLKLGWQGKPLTVTSKGTEVPGTVHALWLTAREPVRRALFDRRGATVNQSAPVLLFLQHGNPKRLPAVDAVEFVEWSKCLNAAFDYRRNASPENPGIIAMDKHARQVAEELYEQFADALVRVPESLHPYLSWLPDLPLRLFSVLLVSKTIGRALDMKPTIEAQEPPKRDPNDLQATMQQAVRLTRWLCQEHYRVVCSYKGAASTDSAREATDSTDMAALEEVILQRLKDHGPLHPRDLQRRFHALSAQARDSAIQRLKSKGLVTIEPDGMLRQAA
ncbi:MAG: hypothetical protein K9N47_13595 [Prosthecobacter sp.]|uniref:MarR family transcriptional regulator n=1 Tax=Prosthecobacter sp. TaxID=1965333 RepID=UPI0025EE2817|nr:helix-turn-helix domain-containing protein [Prosthecobacter sp.]MCF7787155.1 hypothetical protein [Prosthecobacter sp.]